MESRSVGTVTRWSDDEGWGIIESPDTPGGCWAHFSVVLGRGDELRSLTVGAIVPFSWEAADQDRFRFRATSVGSGTATIPHHGPSSAYSSTLTITYDEPDPKERP